jgi:hypothetical protein
VPVLADLRPSRPLRRCPNCIAIGGIQPLMKHAAGSRPVARRLPDGHRAKPLAENLARSRPTTRTASG